MEPKKEIQEELEQISPFLAGLDKTQNFKVPVNYFEEMQEDLWQKVAPESKSAPVAVQKKTWLSQLDEWLANWFQPRLALSLASLLLLLTAGWYFMSSVDGSEELVAVESSLLDDEAYDYFAQNFDEFDAELLSQLDFDDEEIDAFVESNFSGDGEFDVLLEDLLQELDIDELEGLLL